MLEKIKHNKKETAKEIATELIDRYKDDYYILVTVREKNTEIFIGSSKKKEDKTQE